MKTRYMIAATLTAGLLASGVSQAAPYTGWMEQSLVAVCKASLTNRPVTFNQTMKTYRINGYNVLPNLMCNGEDIHTFALSRGNDRTAARIERFIPGTVTIQDLSMNQPVHVWFEE
ncbi:DUF3718 domain-containing protein [Ferrimonas balearica]|uniref:DUF3718 domain-containing protein n=1 Tax=Ferrimonas balearica TaxID=44012 RepID=UPI001C98EC51|nr:DUF3718 domain-containing protein [Ferrimonas balearica]MBY5921384.1 DUF3718 domain-containing protein [Ferrimonas balearica]MBY5995931.1 DUF3718 domain-containing protein [Ferrimonas balearica]